MKISKTIFAIVIASTFLVTSCRDTKTKTETTEEHGHEHDADGNHKEDKVVSQEEFNVNGTSENNEKNVEVNQQSNKTTIVVKANKALEYKFMINQYEKLEYEWNADAPLHYDFHGDPETKEDYPSGYFESYAIGNSDHAKGKVTIPYKGSHGWYWRNESGKDITITLTTKGKYNIVGLNQ
jgi:hypothetical protein